MDATRTLVDVQSKTFGRITFTLPHLLLYMGTERPTSKQAQGLSRTKPFLYDTNVKYAKAVG